jgi:hypothetical protein
MTVLLPAPFLTCQQHGELLEGGNTDGISTPDNVAAAAAAKTAASRLTCCALLPGVFQNERRRRRRAQQVLAVPRGALLLLRVSNQGLPAAQEGVQEVRIAAASV